MPIKHVERPVIHLQIVGLRVLGLAVSQINESNSQLMSLEHYF